MNALLDHLNAGHCPDCGGTKFLSGPEGGLCQNIKCDGCGSEFNYCPPCPVAPHGIVERIGDKKGSAKCLVGNAQLLSIGRYDREMAITLKAVLNMLEEGDFIAAQSAAEVLVQQIRTHRIEASADESGVASR